MQRGAEGWTAATVRKPRIRRRSDHQQTSCSSILLAGRDLGKDYGRTVDVAQAIRECCTGALQRPTNYKPTMTTYALRCRNAACRHRRTSKTHPDDYRRVPACEVCGSVKGWRIESCRSWHKRQACSCGQVVGRDGPIPHNRWHPLCDQHPEGKRNQLLRQGIAEVDLPIELMGKPCQGDCPF